MSLILDIYANGEPGWTIVDTLVVAIRAPDRRNAPIVIDGLRDAVERYFQGAVRTSENDELIVGFDYEIRSRASWLQFVASHLAADEYEFSHEQFWVQGARVRVLVRFIPRTCLSDIQSGSVDISSESGGECEAPLLSDSEVGFTEGLTEEAPWDRVGEYQPGRRRSSAQYKIKW